MILKLRKDRPYKKDQVLVYTTEDKEGEYGFVALLTNGAVLFKITEGKWLSPIEMGFIYEFMDRLGKTAKGEILDTLGDEIYYNETRQDSSPDSPSQQQSI